MTQTTIAVDHLGAGDYVKAEFRELSNDQFLEPTGRTYLLEGHLKTYTGMYDGDREGLAMPNGQAVVQSHGEPGGNLVRIITHAPKETA